MKITPTHVEVDSDLCEIPGLSEPELKIEASTTNDKGKACCSDTGGACDELSAKRCAGTRIPYEYLVYVRLIHRRVRSSTKACFQALGSHLPKPIKSDAVTKADGMGFLQRQQELIAKSSDVLVIGGGALGVQFATE